MNKEKELENTVSFCLHSLKFYDSVTSYVVKGVLNIKNPVLKTNLFKQKDLLTHIKSDL